jgi:hypothetical protein
MTIQEALVIRALGWTDDNGDSKVLYGKSEEILKHEYQRLSLEQKKKMLEWHLKQTEKELQQHKLPF